MRLKCLSVSYHARMEMRTFAANSSSTTGFIVDALTKAIAEHRLHPGTKLMRSKCLSVVLRHRRRPQSPIRPPAHAGLRSPTIRNAAIELAAKDLNVHAGVFCPNPLADMKLWNTHPKIYLHVAKTGAARSPYCGTVYRLKAEKTVGHRH